MDLAYYRGKTVDDHSIWVIGYLVAKARIAVVDKDGLVGAEVDVDENTIGLCSNQQDLEGTKIYQGDVIENENGLMFEVRYGVYSMYCPVDDCMMQNTGFFAVADGYFEDMPLGPTDDYARVVGNVHDNPEFRVGEEYRCPV